MATGLLALRALTRRARTIELAGRVALGTGGSRGLGLVVAPELAARGVRLELSADVLGLMERALPSSSGNGNELRKGWQSTPTLSPSVLTRLGDRAARRNNEVYARPAGIDPRLPAQRSTAAPVSRLARPGRIFRS